MGTPQYDEKNHLLNLFMLVSLASQFALPQPSDIELDKLLMMAPHIDIEYDITCT